MAEPDRLLSRADLAEHLHISERTLMRHLPKAGISPIRIGRAMLFNDADIKLIEDSLRCPCELPGSGENTGTRVGQSKSGKSRSKSKNTAQDAARELMRKMLQRDGTRKSARTSLVAIGGGRDESR